MEDDYIPILSQIYVNLDQIELTTYTHELSHELPKYILKTSKFWNKIKQKRRTDYDKIDGLQSLYNQQMLATKIDFIKSYQEEDTLPTHRFHILVYEGYALPIPTVMLSESIVTAALDINIGVLSDEHHENSNKLLFDNIKIKMYENSHL